MARILVVDDDGALRHHISGRLIGWGHEVKTAADGSKGFDVVRVWKPDLVLSDINMPHATGFDLVSRIAGQGAEYAGIAFIFVSSLSGSKAMASGIKEGADDYIVKPIDFDLLKAKVDAHLRKKGNLMSFASIEHAADSMAGSMVNGFMFIAVIGVVGFVLLLVLYWIKTALGLNFFENMHLHDFF